MPIHNPLHPGEIVHEILIEGAALSISQAATKLGVNRTTLSRLLNGHAGLSPDMALRLTMLLPDTSITMWLNLQRDYDIWYITHHSKNIHIKPLEKAA